ncbi:MAG: elongation factor P maturation arginine rhamnosyltransferase EarP, partial [Polaromonas sp.]|nr:elongation factor P maturation arginine rhamnosyltransferase EarP [Polaromonas sp.]
QHASNLMVDVMVEAFGCEIAPEFIAAQAIIMTANRLNQSEPALQPVWINLEYLSAQTYVERCHALPSLQTSGPAAGWTKWFFYPGFTRLTGGLLREQDLASRQDQFNVQAWLNAQGLPTIGEKRISLFCYEPSALSALLAQLHQRGLHGEPVRLLVAAGRAEQAVKKAIATGFNHSIDSEPSPDLASLLSISYLPLFTQTEFDHLLWACDVNFVRGEDSLVRALWAGQPWVWHIYPQDDAAHHAKLQALLSRLDAPDTLQAFHEVWNESCPGPLPPIDLAAWRAFAASCRKQLLEQTDLASQLLSFAASKKS